MKRPMKESVYDLTDLVDQDKSGDIHYSTDGTRTMNHEGMIDWDQSTEAMDLGDSHPEDKVVFDYDGNVIHDPEMEGQVDGGDEEPEASPEEELPGDSRTTGEPTKEPAMGTESPNPQPTQPLMGIAAQGGQEEPQEAQGEPQGGQETTQGAQEEEQTQEGQEPSQEGSEEQGDLLSVDDPAQAQQLLQNADKMDRPHMLQVAKLIWGDDYEFEDWMTDDYVRADLKGSLEDVLESHEEGVAPVEGEDEEEE